MPRPRLDVGQGRHVSLSAASRTGSSSTGTSRILSDQRSSAYLTALSRLDASVTLTPVETAEMVDAIHREFADHWATVPLGIVSHCYLGPPFEAHTLALDGSIIEHYRRGEPLPGLMEQARSLTRGDTYLCIEVYSNRLVCVRQDGSVVIMGAN